CTGRDSAAASSAPQPVPPPAAPPAGDDRAADDSGADGGLSVVDPGWDVAAQESEGVFLSLHEADSDLEFRAVDSAGTILWSATRPRVCSGFLVSDSEDGPVAVLMDQQSDGNDTLDATASGFDLATGEKLWARSRCPARCSAAAWSSRAHRRTSSAPAGPAPPSIPPAERNWPSRTTTHRASSPSSTTTSSSPTVRSSSVRTSKDNDCGPGPPRTWDSRPPRLVRPRGRPSGTPTRSSAATAGSAP